MKKLLLLTFQGITGDDIVLIIFFLIFLAGIYQLYKFFEWLVDGGFIYLNPFFKPFTLTNFFRITLSLFSFYGFSFIESSDGFTMYGYAYAILFIDGTQGMFGDLSWLDYFLVVLIYSIVPFWYLLGTHLIANDDDNRAKNVYKVERDLKKDKK